MSFFADLAALLAVPEWLALLGQPMVKNIQFVMFGQRITTPQHVVHTLLTLVETMVQRVIYEYSDNQGCCQMNFGELVIW